MTTMSDDDTTTDPHERDKFDSRSEARLAPDDEHAGPDWYPRLWSMSSAMMFRAIIRPDAPARPEYVTIPMPTRHQDPDIYGGRNLRGGAVEPALGGRPVPPALLPRRRR
jgi:hypothetical protein